MGLYPRGLIIGGTYNRGGLYPGFYGISAKATAVEIYGVIEKFRENPKGDL